MRKNIERDLDTDIFLKENGINVIRFWEHDIKDDLKQSFNNLKKLIKQHDKNN